jgi:hypothetical protein
VIISHKHKFIFIAIPKTATHAIRNGLRKSMGDDDLEQVDLFHKKRLPFESLSKISHGHITAEEIMREIGEEQWNSYFKFAFVRNPFDRFISYSFFKKNKNEVLQKFPLPFLKLMFKDDRVVKDVLFRPQLDFICNKKGDVIVDYIGYFEKLQESFDDVCMKLGLPLETLLEINKSDHADYEQYYDDELRGLVSNHYKRDIEKFEYM